MGNWNLLVDVPDDVRCLLPRHAVDADLLGQGC
jgi:hypothetical protein